MVNATTPAPLSDFADSCPYPVVYSPVPIISTFTGAGTTVF
jgi:hypothetical protein